MVKKNSAFCRIASLSFKGKSDVMAALYFRERCYSYRRSSCETLTSTFTSCNQTPEILSYWPALTDHHIEGLVARLIQDLKVYLALWRYKPHKGFRHLKRQHVLNYLCTVSQQGDVINTIAVKTLSSGRISTSTSSWPEKAFCGASCMTQWKRNKDKQYLCRPPRETAKTVERSP